MDDEADDTAGAMDDCSKEPSLTRESQEEDMESENNENTEMSNSSVQRDSQVVRRVEEENMKQQGVCAEVEEEKGPSPIKVSKPLELYPNVSVLLASL